ncbi:MAG: hypothetical protein KKC68_05470 [Candidatus Thermoplasmatota archaeon]|nr:hypothetical protein [Candidatus Thermoplasmatota archaeon]MBU1941204.1 hypothetical protein [Candidatus Thermoplasmatota archaeon]
MNKRNGIILLVVIASLIFSCSIAAAETLSDPTGDVYRWTNTASGWSWQYNVGDKPDIDITQLSAEVTGSTLTLTLKVDGTIQNSENIVYWAYYNSTDTTYWMSWANSEGMGFATQTSETGGNFGTGNVSASGDTITCTFDIIGDDTAVNFYAYASEFTEMNDISNEWWGDWAPNDQSPYTPDTSGDDTGGDTSGGTDDNSSGGTPPPKTPGFEAVLLIGALAIAMILLRKRE